MKFHTRTRYGLRTMIEIAAGDKDCGVYQKDIAQNQSISVKYLDQIINSLKVAGLITNVKGKKSGYQLTRPAAQITMLDIHNAFEFGICVVDCTNKSFHCDKRGSCAAEDFWGNLNNKIIDHFRSVTLEELAAEQKQINLKHQPEGIS
jgi:rrf2 family protein (putative transcriptional regulator)